MAKMGKSAWPLLTLPVVCALILVAVFAFDDGDGPQRVSAGAGGAGAGAGLSGFEAILGKMPVPPGNPQTDEKVELGKMLFFDPRLSGNNQISCASCHNPDTGWTTPAARFLGPEGELGRNAPTIWNAAYVDFPFWDGRTSSLEEQAGGPMRAKVEMAATVPEMVEELKKIPEYQKRFEAVFGPGSISFTNVSRAIAAFERTIITSNSAFDKHEQGNRSALSAEQKRGREIFFGSTAQCSSCHTPPLFSDNRFHALGVPAEGPKTEDPGRFEVTGDEVDRGAFKTPTLRNVELTGPYMHTGGLKTLEDVVAFYNAGGGEAENKDKTKVKPLNLSAADQKALVAFLRALTDNTLKVTKPKLPGLDTQLAAGAGKAGPVGKAAAAAPKGPAAKVGAEVAIKNVAFAPKDVTVKAGEAVRWTWKEGLLHNVTATDGSAFKSANLTAGTFVATLAKPGTYRYSCTVHGPTMSGTVTVE